MKTKKTKKSAFTLIEIVVALALFSILSITLFTSFRSYTSTIKRESESSLESVRLQRTVREIEEYLRMSTQDVSLTKVGNKYQFVDEGEFYPHRMDIILDGNKLTINKEPHISAEKAVIMSNKIQEITLNVDVNKLIVTVKSTVPGIKPFTKHIQLRGQFRREP